MGLVRQTYDRWFGRSTLLTWSQYQELFKFNGHTYPVMPSTSIGSAQEEPSPSFEGYLRGIYQSNGVVFACMAARMRLFSEARFQFRQLRSGRPGELFGNAALAPLERPWKNATTGDLLARAITDADISGNFYAARRGQRIRRMRPDWVSIVLGSDTEPDDPAFALDAEVAGYVYHPGGAGARNEPVILTPEEVCHFAPIPDPGARFRGMSWLTPIVREVMGDAAATEHKLKFFEQGATVNLVVTFDSPIIKTQDQFEDMVRAFKRGHEGMAQAYKTVFLAHGSSAAPIGTDNVQADLKRVQGAGETRICMAAGVPPIIVGASEGLAAATYSNYGQARRAFADLTMRPLWRNVAGSLASIVDVPADAELWYDDRDVPFLQEDVQDGATIQQTQASSIKMLVDAGFEQGSVIDAVVSGDFKRLKHTGLFSVQLQPPGTEQEPTPNGNGVPIGAVDG